MSERKNSDKYTENSLHYISDRVVTIPNILCAIRLVGSIILVPTALLGQKETFLWLFVFLSITDWLDGKLAHLLNQRTVIGARLDTWADAALYAALLFGVIILYRPTVHAEVLWIIPVIVTYIASISAGLLKYRRWPSYHTRAAKTSWLLILLAVIALFTGWSVWPLRIAATAVALTNLEAFCITLITPQWRADVTSIYHAWRDNRSL